MVTKALSLLLLTAIFLSDELPVQAQTQFELTKAGCDRYAKVDADLNRVYKQILASHAKDATFVAKFQAAERAWVLFRDAYLASLYPDPDPMAYGTVNLMCRCGVLEELTAQRTKQLRELWVKGTAEGNVCVGSGLVLYDEPKPARKKQ